MDATNDFKAPNYKRDFYWVTQILTYRQFCHDLNKLNGDAILDRPTTERAWSNLCKTKFYDWEGGESYIDVVKQAMLVSAIAQVEREDHFDVEAYWLGRAAMAMEKLGVELNVKSELDHIDPLAPVVDQNSSQPSRTEEDLMREQWALLFEPSRDGVSALAQGLAETHMSSDAMDVDEPQQEGAGADTASGPASIVHPGLLLRNIDESYDFEDEEM